MTSAEFVQGLRDAANFFETHSELGPPHEDLHFHFYSRVGPFYADSKEGLAFFAKSVGGHLDKTGSNENFFRMKSDRGTFSVSIVSTRNSVCERIKVGTKIEPAHVVPAQEETFVPEREVPIYEYRCPSILARPSVEIEGELPELAAAPTLQLEAENIPF
jgi:hypothetical protein